MAYSGNRRFATIHSDQSGYYKMVVYSNRLPGDCSGDCRGHDVVLGEEIDKAEIFMEVIGMIEKYQNLIGKIIISIAIIVAAIIIADAIRIVGANISSSLSYMGELLR